VKIPPAPATGWRSAFPPAQWLASYQSQWLAHDAVAGVTLAAYAIPVALAYATLAGARMLAKLHADLKAAGIELRLAGAHAAVRDILRSEGLEERAGYFGRRVTAVDILDEFEARS
jgi:MFS superfamily sulfate permease-like transporter